MSDTPPAVPLGIHDGSTCEICGALATTTNHRCEAHAIPETFQREYSYAVSVPRENAACMCGHETAAHRKHGDGNAMHCVANGCGCIEYSPDARAVPRENPPQYVSHDPRWFRHISGRLYALAARLPPLGQPYWRIPGDFSDLTIAAELLNTSATEIAALRTECSRLREDAGRPIVADSVELDRLPNLSVGALPIVLNHRVPRGEVWVSLEDEIVAKIVNVGAAARSSRPENPET